MTAGPSDVELAAMLLLEQALDRPPETRIDYIRGRTDIEAAVRDHAVMLLQADRDAPEALRTGGAGAGLAEEGAPPAIAGYRILEQIGRGGMGAVYLAERDTADFRHRVAIKVIKSGVLSERLIDRFRRERQILAQLNHPNIAHLHDGGETADGQPYIVMEYVPGPTLRVWLKEEAPSLERRIALFRQVALAVEFAHQNLVIHRDLTPNNVLIAEGEQAKLIDFGIARPQVADQDGAASSPFSGLSLTPGFAAPERARGEASNTLSDIYSLGKILALMIGPDRQPELEAIAARAAAEDPAGRYPGAGEMMDDIDRFAAGRPVRAYSGARAYALRKFLAREKGLVGAVAALFLALAVGLGGTLWAYGRAERQRAVAEQRFDELRDLANFQIFDLHDRMNRVVGNTAARAALMEKAQAYLVGLAESRSADRQLQLETADGFVKLALIQGVAAHPNLGEADRARSNLDRAEALFRELAEKGMVRAEAGLARALGYRALLLAHTGSKPKESRVAVDEAERRLARVPAAERDWNWMLARRVVRLAALEWADLEMETAMVSRYAGLLERDIAEWPKAKRGGFEARFDRALAENYHAVVLYNSGEPGPSREAVRRYLHADALYAALERDFPNDPLVLYRRGWNAYYGYAAAETAGEYARGEALLAQAKESVDRLLAIEERDQSLVAFAERLREAQAELFSNNGRHDEAIALQKAIVDARRAKVDADRPLRALSDLAYGMAIFGSIYRKAGRREEACRSWTEAELLMAELKRRDGLSGYVESLRKGVNANLDRCRAGRPVGEMRPLSEG